MNRETIRVDNQGDPSIENYIVTHEHSDIASILIQFKDIYSINFIGHNSEHYPAIDIDIDLFESNSQDKQCWTTVSFPKYKGWNVLAYHAHGKKMTIVLENPVETL